MRRVSKKRMALNAAAKEWRDDFKAELKRCEWCQRRVLAIHEIARGAADRKKAMTTRYATLGLCDPGCHQIVGAWPRAKQLALLLWRRPSDFSLERFWALTARRSPDISEVLAYLDQLKEQVQ